ncbi:hypothetical protein [Pandoraea sputorum]
MKRYAIVVAGIVENVVFWDGETECAAIPESAVELSENSPVGPGYTFGDGVFKAPPDPPYPPVAV